MLVVRLDVWPEGRQNEAYPVGEIHIANDATGTVDIADYDVVVLHGGRFYGKPGAYKTGRVLRFVRDRGPYALLQAALTAALGPVAATRSRPSVSSAPRATKPCNGCGQPIVWTTTPQGRRMPLDPEPLQVVVGSGDLRVVLEDGQVVAARRHEGTDMHEPVLARVSHFATCPKADRFRS